MATKQLVECLRENAELKEQLRTLNEQNKQLLKQLQSRKDQIRSMLRMRCDSEIIDSDDDATTDEAENNDTDHSDVEAVDEIGVQIKMEPQAESGDEVTEEVTEEATMIIEDVKHEGFSYLCNTCGASFLHPSDLASHRMIHGFNCRVCSESFLEWIDLNEHLRVHHKQPTTCAICGKDLKTPAQFKEHLRNHSKARYYPCVLCNRKFGMGRKLKSHIQLSHSDNETVFGIPITFLEV